MKTIKKLEVKKVVKGKQVKKVELKTKSFEELKKIVPKLEKSIFQKIVEYCKDNKQDIRVSEIHCSGVKILNMFYSGAFKTCKGKIVNVLDITKGILHTVNASDRALMYVLGLIDDDKNGSVEKFYSVDNRISHRKALSLRFKK